MDRVVKITNYGAVLIYLVVGISGYLTFSDRIDDEILNAKTNGNILECNYQGSILIYIVRLVAFY